MHIATPLILPYKVAQQLRQHQQQQHQVMVAQGVAAALQ
jgi:hypothetical protein